MMDVPFIKWKLHKPSPYYGWYAALLDSAEHEWLSTRDT